MQNNKEKIIEKMDDYFTAIIAIAERSKDEYGGAIRTIALDASKYFYEQFGKNTSEVKENEKY